MCNSISLADKSPPFNIGDCEPEDDECGRGGGGPCGIAGDGGCTGSIDADIKATSVKSRRSGVPLSETSALLWTNVEVETGVTS